MARARLVTLDITNTCIGIRGSLGHQYARLAAEAGVKVNPSQVPRLNTKFKEVFRKTSKEVPNFGLDCHQTSEEWWRKVVTGTFAAVGIRDEEKLKLVGDLIYKDFAGPNNWQVFSDVEPALALMRKQKLKVGVISNFDERLEGILAGLGLEKHFDFVLSTYNTGFSKPDSRIFNLALKKASVDASGAVHIGDSYELDYLGAKQVGIKPLLIDRGETTAQHDLNVVKSIQEAMLYITESSK